ncbi:hypothetical protein QBC43DRAFT_9620 [Cladorrhinum sp. PSN259]|nr:hypothetical protein QBC43DRAFT_9620 [Cladorrhinum sp. PSN259]
MYDVGGCNARSSWSAWGHRANLAVCVFGRLSLLILFNARNRSYHFLFASIFIGIQGLRVLLENYGKAGA